MSEELERAYYALQKQYFERDKGNIKTLLLKIYLAEQSKMPLRYRNYRFQSRIIDLLVDMELIYFSDEKTPHMPDEKLIRMKDLGKEIGKKLQSEMEQLRKSKF